jgi:hypothetical protein
MSDTIDVIIGTGVALFFCAAIAAIVLRRK